MASKKTFQLVKEFSHYGFPHCARVDIKLTGVPPGFVCTTNLECTSVNAAITNLG